VTFTFGSGLSVKKRGARPARQDCLHHRKSWIVGIKFECVGGSTLSDRNSEMGTISVSTRGNPSWSWPKTRRERFISLAPFLPCLGKSLINAENDEMNHPPRSDHFGRGCRRARRALRLAKAVGPLLPAVKVGLSTFHCGGTRTLPGNSAISAWMFFLDLKLPDYRTRSLEPWKRRETGRTNAESPSALAAGNDLCGGTAAPPICCAGVNRVNEHDRDTLRAVESTRNGDQVMQLADSG